MKSALFVTLLLVAFGCASAGLLPNYYKGKWFDLGKPILASTTVDCAVKTVAWKFAKVLLPEYLDNQAVYDSFQLQNCGVERPQADPVLKRPEEKYIYPGKDLYVDGTNGDDSNDGSFEHPFKTILHAIQASRSIEGKRVIYVRAGYYYIENPIVLSNVDEGLTITSYKNEEVIFSGAKKINVEWKSVTKDSWKVFSARNILGTMKYEPGQDIEGRALYKGKFENAENCTALCLTLEDCHATVYFPKKDESATSEMCYHIISNDNIMVYDPTAISSVKMNLYEADLSSFDLPKFNQLYINDYRQTLARFPNGDVQYQGYHTEPSGFASSSYGHWDGPSQIRKGFTYTVSEPHLEKTLYNNYNMAFGGEGARWNPPVSYWALDNPRGGGGCTYRIIEGVTLSTDILDDTRGWKLDAENPPIFHAFHYGYWGFWMFEVDNITSVESSSTPLKSYHLHWTKGGYQEARGGSSAGNFFIENVLEELDYPNEWFYDTRAKKLYWYPNSTYVNPDNHINYNELIIPLNKQLFEIRGLSGAPVRDITISGIQFKYTPTTYMDEFYVPSGGDVAITPSAILYIENAEDIHIEYNIFTQFGGNAIFVKAYFYNSVIEHNHIYNGGDSGIIFQGVSQHIDGTDGQHPHNNTIASNLIHDLGLYMKQSAPIIQSKTARTHIVGNVLFNVPRAGLLINDAFGGGYLVERNLIYNTVRETADHGPINTWDRIPFVTLYYNGQPSMRPETSNITNNFLFANYHAVWPLDHDDGSCYYYDTYNVLVYGGFKNYLGHSKISKYNLYIYPDTKYAGDESNEFFTEPHCINTGGATLNESGWGDEYQYNECILKNKAVYMETSCSEDKETLLELVTNSDYNTIYTPNGEDGSYIACGQYQWPFSKFREYGLDVHTTFKPLPNATEIAEKAAAMLHM